VIKRVLMLSILLTGTLVAQEAKVTPLLSKDLTGIPGKEALMITVDVRVVGRNASKSKSAKFLVVFVKNKGAPLLLTAK
jgi:archaellum component FlaG (FlaF/FlaG flagellin family)